MIPIHSNQSWYVTVFWDARPATSITSHGLQWSKMVAIPNTYIYIRMYIYIYILHIYIYIYILHIYIYITLEYSNPLTNREYEEFRLWDSFNMAHMHRLCPSCSYTSAKSWRGMPLPEFSWGTVLRNPRCRRFWRDSGLKMSEKGKPSKIVCKSISHWF